MKQATANAIRNCIKAFLAELQRVPSLPEEGHWEYHRESAGNWGGRLVPKPNLMRVVDRQLLQKLVPDIESALKQDYPESLQLFGPPGSSAPLQPAMILQQLARAAHERFGTFALNDEQINAILLDVSTFFDRRTVRLRLHAPALNLHGPLETPQITLPGGIILRPITDEECTKFYGGNPIFHLRQMPTGFPDFVFVKEIEIPKIFGQGDGIKDDPIFGPFQTDLDLCILALATFKDAGAVGYDGIRISPSEFTLGSSFADYQMYRDEHVPFSRYELTVEEAPRIEAHARNLEGIHPTLEMASQRLVDSVRRTKPRDAIVDAVIGLEGILLANLQDGRTELGFRFALHYALLFAIRRTHRSIFHRKGSVRLEEHYRSRQCARRNMED